MESDTSNRITSLLKYHGLNPVVKQRINPKMRVKTDLHNSYINFVIEIR